MPTRGTTVILGPWDRPRKPALPKRDRPFRYAGRYWLERWPAGVKRGAPGIKRAPLPAAPALPPLVFVTSPNQSSRDGSSIRYLVVHETEGSYAGAVSWLVNPDSRASAHVVLSEDGNRSAQLVPFSRKAWHASDYNDESIGLELAGFTASPNQLGQLEAAARIIAALCLEYSIPAVIGNPARGGHGGIVTHRMLGAAGGGHHDPGGFDFGALVDSAGREVRRGGFRSWGRR